MLCVLYQFSFSLDFWEGEILCVRPSLAMGIHWGALAYILYIGAYDMSAHARGEGDKVVGMQLYIHRAMCMCVVEICRSYTCRFF